MSARQARIASIERYPVKGLSPERLAATVHDVGQTVPADRLYAIENGASGSAAPADFPKQRFLMLMRNERLAGLGTRFDQSSHTLTGREGGREATRGALRSAAGRRAIEAFFAAFCADELRGLPPVLHAPGHSFSDVARTVVSIINLASIAAVGDLLGAAVAPLRFRANLYVEDWPAWNELKRVGDVLSIGPHARLKLVKRIQRCAATNVEPGTGIRDMAIPQSLPRALGHTDYAEVIGPGPIAPGDRITVSAKD